MNVSEFRALKKPTPRDIWELTKHYKNIVIFLCGFLFDSLTITRIDALTDLLIQISYLFILSLLLIYQYRYHKKLWTPGPKLAKIWQYDVEILHFLYGGLLSAYVILYFKSTSGVRALFFLAVLFFLLIINEMPQVRRLGYRLRLGLYAFCVCSFLIYFVPILIGRMNEWIFILSVILSAVLVWFVAGLLVGKGEDQKKVRLRLYTPAIVLFILVLVLYHFRLIPPVPLSIQYQGVFHSVKKNHSTYTLRYPKPPFYAFWRDDSRPFLWRKEDSVFYFIRIFAPSRFKHQAQVRWEYYDEVTKEFLETDLIPLKIIGGRDQGFRGYVSKYNVKPGRWRITTLTQSKRIIGRLTFELKPDKGEKKRIWKEIKM